MLNSSLVDRISDKNAFVDLCLDRNIPTLPSYPFYSEAEYFDTTRRRLIDGKTYILKPVNDRLVLEDKRRQFFLCNDLATLDSCVSRECYGIGGGVAGFQVQEYIDFRKAHVRYYNTAFRLSDDVTEHLTTLQLINLSAIEANIPATHWGNMHAIPHSMLEKGKAYARDLAGHYLGLGYHGELGIDFGVTDNQIFFLETNARINNATRLFYYLAALGEDPATANYIYIRNSVLEQLQDRIEEFRRAGDVKFLVHPDDRSLIISENSAHIDAIYDLIDSLAHASPPFPG